MGGMVAGFYGFSAVFITTSTLLLIAGLVLYFAMHRNPELARSH
jgi:hypothetical protein